MLHFTTSDFTYHKDPKTFVEESSMLGLKPQYWNSLRREPVETEIMLTNPKTKQSSIFHFIGADMSPENEVSGWNYENDKKIYLLIIND